MGVGYQAWTDTGLAQIDGVAQNYVLRQNFLITTASGDMNAGKSNAGNQYTLKANIADFIVYATAPFIALYSPSAYATMLWCIKQSEGIWSVRLWSNTAAIVGVYIFDQAAVVAPTGPGFGLQVFDEAGNLVADARQRLARVIDIQIGNINNAGPGWGQWAQVDGRAYQFSYPQVSKIGVGALGTAFVSSPTGGSNNGWYNMSGLQTAGSTVNFNYAYYAQGNTSHPGNNNCFGSQYDWRFMAVDLSNI
ncbi:hypothetical protein IQ288_13395 [Burkholderia sp. R-69980]|nr:hypothetical protein [Burkholderia sp. R-69980]